MTAAIPISGKISIKNHLIRCLIVLFPVFENVRLRNKTTEINPTVPPIKSCSAAGENTSEIILITQEMLPVINQPVPIFMFLILIVKE